MGLFSSKKVTQVGTAVKRVVEDEQMPDSVKAGLFKALLSDNSNADIPAYVLEEMNRSIAVRSERLHDWAANNYVHGLPSGQFLDTQEIRQAAQDVISSNFAGSPQMEYCHVGSANDMHIAWGKLIDDYGYDPVTNEIVAISTIKGFPVYLEDMRVHVSTSSAAVRGAESLENWGISPRAGFTPFRSISPAQAPYVSFSPPVLDAAATQDFVRVTYVWPDSSGQGAPVPVTETLDLVTYLGEEEIGKDYVHARFPLLGKPKYWFYRLGAGTYPTLDSLATSPVAGQFFPMCYFRLNKAATNTNPVSEEFKDSRKFCKYLGLDYDTIASAIDENPDIGDVEQALLYFGVPGVSSDPLETRYLFEFFDNLFASSGQTLQGSQERDLAKRALSGTPAKQYGLVIQDAIFKMVLSNEGMHKRLVTGSLGPVGTHTTQYVKRTEYVSYEAEGDSGPITMTMPVVVRDHFYRKQVSPNVYQEIQVINLKLQYYVFGDYNVTADENDEILLIPLDRAITTHYSSRDRELLYARALHMVFNSVVVTKVKWYQQGWFADLLTIVAIIATIASLGMDGGSFIAGALAVSAGTAAYFAVFVIERLLLTALAKEALQLFVKAVGVDLAFLLAVVAAAAGIYKGIDAGTFLGDAEILLQTSNSLVKGIGDNYAEKLENLSDEYSEFAKFVEEQTKLLESAQDLLGQNNHLSPVVVFGESPDDFYNRTVHAGNIGTLGFAAVSNYVDTALKLPKFNETIGESNYEPV